MKKLNILIASSEAVPFSKTGGLADVIGSLPLALASLGHKVAVFLPYYRFTKRSDFGIKVLKSNVKIHVGQNSTEFSIYHCRKRGVDFYFIDEKEYFNRDFLYGTPSGDYPDNAVRFAFFSCAVLAACEEIDFKPDIIHCNDWHTALIPFYLKHKEINAKVFENSKILFTIHNLAYQGVFSKEVMEECGINKNFFNSDSLEFYGKINFMKAGILYSDTISTVSKTYAKEILTKKLGCGLEGLLGIRKSDIYGIINGCDYAKWDPKTDRAIKANYNNKTLKNKIKCKKDLLKQTKLSLNIHSPLLGVVTRLSYQKGIDIIIESIPRIVTLGCGLVILGFGCEKYHKKLIALAKKYPKNIAVRIGFDDKLAHKIEAGSDMFLMPSRYEPCGLSQIYSFKYGTIPIVRATGGLQDTVIDYNKDSVKGNGFKFFHERAADFIETLKKAILIYKNNRKWNSLSSRVMKLDFSWEKSAKKYIDLYEKTMREK